MRQLVAIREKETEAEVEMAIDINYRNGESDIYIERDGDEKSRGR